MKKRADTLVQVARLNAIESFVPISDKFPKINELFKSKKVDEWDSNGNRALTDIGDFITRNTGQGIPHHIAVGSWIIWKIKRAEPTKSELDIAPTIGGMLLGSFSDWWVGEILFANK